MQRILKIRSFNVILFLTPHSIRVRRSSSIADLNKMSDSSTPEPQPENMLLIIPAIDLRGEFCVRRKDSSYVREQVFFDDPVKMARLWRIQNAKALHISGHDEGETCDREVLSRICGAVDIPVQLHAVFSDLHEIATAIEAGVYRVILDIRDTDDLPLFTEALERFGPSRIIGGLCAREGILDGTGDLTAVDVAGKLETLGCRRIVYTDLSDDHDLTDSCLDAFCRLGNSLRKSRITAAGGVRGYGDLMKLVGLKSARVDSAVIGLALYENQFPCQNFWCWNYKDEIDLDQFTTARIRTES